MELTKTAQDDYHLTKYNIPGWCRSGDEDDGGGDGRYGPMIHLSNGEKSLTKKDIKKKTNRTTGEKMVNRMDKTNNNQPQCFLKSKYILFIKRK